MRTKTYIRALNEKGIDAFRNALHQITAGEEKDIPVELLSDGFLSDIITTNIEVEPLKFTTKAEIVIYIYERIVKLNKQDVYYNQGLWSWLSAYYFDSVCPVKSDGTRRIGADDRHILNPEEWTRYYRHLIASPVRLYHELGNSAEIYLLGSPDKHGDLMEQLASRQEVATCKGIIEAASLLYWDEAKNKIKIGARNKDGKGVLRRFTQATIPQFQMTYDLNAMNGKQVVNLLPSEYDGWKSI